MQYEKLYLEQIKRKNNKIKSQYIHLCEMNVGRERALVTFTVCSLDDKSEQLLLIQEIKNYFAKRLQNLKSNIQYFSVIELGKNRDNPHLHTQIFYNKEDLKRVEESYQKTIQYFKLDEVRCKLTLNDRQLKNTSSHNYIIKEYDNKQLSNDEILSINRARAKLRRGKAQYLQFHSKSRATHIQSVYRTLYFTHNLNYFNVNELFHLGYIKRIESKKVEKSSLSLEYLRCEKVIIEIKLLKLYELFLLSYCYLFVSSEKCIYCNKKDKTHIFKISSMKILYNSLINKNNGINNGHKRFRIRARSTKFVRGKYFR
jgi:hypothetical protein